MLAAEDHEETPAGLETAPPLVQQFISRSTRHLQDESRLLQLPKPQDSANESARVEAAEVAAAMTALLDAPDSAALLSHPSVIQHMCTGGGVDYLTTVIDRSPKTPLGVSAAGLLASQPEEVFRYLASERAMHAARTRICSIFIRENPPLPTRLLECLSQILGRLVDTSDVILQEISTLHLWEYSVMKHEEECTSLRELLRKLNTALNSDRAKRATDEGEETEGFLQGGIVRRPVYEDAPTMKEYIECTVRSVLLASHFLRELHEKNICLLDFLAFPKVQAELVRLVTEVDYDSDDAARHFALPFYAAEVFCIGAREVDRAFLCDEETSTARDRFWNILRSEPPLNAVLAGYFSRCWQSFLRSCPLETCAYLRQRGDAEELLSRHLYSRSISDLYKALICSHLGDETKVIDLEGIIPRLLKLLRTHEPPPTPSDTTAAHGAAAAAARAALNGCSPSAVAAAAAAAAEAAKEDGALHQSILAQLDPHLPATLIIRELIFQRGTLQFFAVLLRQLTAKGTMETLTDMILSDCASCLSSAVAIVSDLLSCTCIGKPLSSSGHNSPGGGSTPVPAPAPQQLMQQQQKFLDEMQGNSEEQQGQQQEQKEGLISSNSSGGVSFTRGGGQQQLERQASLLPNGDGDDDSDSDDDYFCFSELSTFPDSLEQRMREHQQSLLQEEYQQEKSSTTAAENEGENASHYARPDTRCVSGNYIQRTLADIPEEPPTEVVSQNGQQDKMCQQQEQQQDEEQHIKNEGHQVQQQQNEQLLQRNQQQHGSEQGEESREAEQQESQDNGQWHADCCLSPYFRFSPPGSIREWLDSLERAEFVELYLVPKLPQLLKQLEYCCCMPPTWRSDVQQLHQPRQQLRHEQPEQHEPQLRVPCDEESHLPKGRPMERDEAVTCEDDSSSSQHDSYTFMRPLRGAQREVHLPNGTFHAVGVEALELLTLAKGLLRIHSEVVAKAVVECGFIEAAVYLLFKYPWNSLLHISVTDLLQAAISRPNETGVIAVIIHRTALLQRVLEHFKKSQMLRVRRVLEIGRRRCSTRFSRSTSRDSGFERRRNSRNDEGTLSIGSTAGSSGDLAEAPVSAAAKTATDNDTSRSSACEGELRESTLVVDTLEGPFSPFDVAAAVLEGGLGRFEEACGYTSHLVQIAQLLTEQRDATEGNAEFSPEWHAIVDAELAFYRLLLHVDKPPDRTVASDVPTLGEVAV